MYIYHVHVYSMLFIVRVLVLLISYSIAVNLFLHVANSCSLNLICLLLNHRTIIVKKLIFTVTYRNTCTMSCNEINLICFLGFNRVGYSGVTDTVGFWSDGRGAPLEAGVWGDFQPDWRGGSCVYVDPEGKWKTESCNVLLPSLCERQACPKGTNIKTCSRIS